jgi:hypothetical protein
MIAPNDKQPRFSQHARHEMVTGSDLRSKLGRWIDRRIHISAEPFLDRGERMHDVLEWSLANDEQIDVARRAELTARRRPEHECHVDAITKRREPLAKDIDEAGGLRKEPTQLRKNRRVAVRLKVHLTPLHRAPNEARGREQLELALNGADSGAGLPDNLPQIVGLVGMPKQPAEQPAPRAAEQDRRGIDARTGCSHDANKRNHIENIGQSVDVGPVTTTSP